MILISYIEPFIVINSDKLLSGTIKLFDSSRKIRFSEKFYTQSYFNIKVKNGFGKTITVVLETGIRKYQKKLSIK